MNTHQPATEGVRSQAVHAFENPGTDSGQDFDDLTFLASHICKTPIAFISLIDEHGQWSASKTGATGSEASHHVAFCAQGILQAGIFVVQDAQADPRFATNPLVTGNNGVRFYAGCPLIAADGQTLGMLCLYDRVPRELNAEQKFGLQALGRQMVALLELRRGLEKLRRIVVQLQQKEDERRWKMTFLEAQVDSSIDGILVVDGQGRKILQNHRFTSLLKIPQHIAEDKNDDVQLQWVTDITKNPGDFIGKVAYLNAHPDEISRDEIELKDRTTLDRYSSPVTDKEGKYYGRIWTFRDITDRKSTDEIVKRLAAIVEHSNEAIISTTLKGIITSWNPAAERMFGYTSAQIIGQPLQVLVPSDHPDEESEILARFAGGEQIRHFETIRIRKDGKRFDVSVALSPVKDSEGRIVGLSKIVRDITERKRTETALQESQLRYCSLFENMLEGYAYCRMLFVRGQPRDFIYLEVNSAFESLTGLKNVVGKKVSEVIPGIQETNLELFEVYSRVALTGKPERYETQVKALGIWISIAVYSHEKKHFFTVFDNITERKLAENTLRESNDKFHQLAAHITDVFWMRSPDLSEVQYLSPGFERIWGRSMASLYANPQQWVDFIWPEDRKRVQNAFAALARDAPSLEIEYRIVRPDGEIRWVRVRGFQIRDASGKLIRHTGIVTDITERHHAAEELRESERRFSDLLRNLELGAVMLDREARITYCNDYLLRITGWRREDLIGRDWFKVFIPQDRQEEMRGIHAALLAGEAGVRHHEGEILTRSGDRLLIHWNNSVLRSASGEVVGRASIGEDITGRKRLEIQLFQLQKMETVGKLAGGIAHEFNSILTAILGQSELLLDELPAGGAQANRAVEIRKAADRAAILTRQLLAYGRKQILQPEIFDLNAVLAGMEGTLRHLLGQGIDLRLAPAAERKAVKADAGQIEQVIVNLALNARDAMPHGGKLTLETANLSFDPDSVGTHPDLKPGDYVLLAISDSGRGMSEAVKARVFEPFFTTKGVGLGTGLGLSICYGIVKQSGGHISVYSELGRGTTFKIYLPQVSEPASPPVQRLDASELPRGTEIVLLVEDDPALREMAATLLRRLGYTVLAAANGIEALSLCHERETGRIDLLFTDVVMPHMSGQELADRMRALHPHTRILFTSAYTETAMVHQGALDQGVALLQKPYSPSALAQRLREALDQGPMNGPVPGHG